MKLYFLVSEQGSYVEKDGRKLNYPATILQPSNAEDNMAALEEFQSTPSCLKDQWCFYL